MARQDRNEEIGKTKKPLQAAGVAFLGTEHSICPLLPIEADLIKPFGIGLPESFEGHFVIRNGSHIPGFKWGAIKVAKSQKLVDLINCPIALDAVYYRSRQVGIIDCDFQIVIQAFFKVKIVGKGISDLNFNVIFHDDNL